MAQRKTKQAILAFLTLLGGVSLLYIPTALESIPVDLGAAQKVVYSLISIAALYLIIRVGGESLILPRVKDAKMQYSMRKSLHIVFYGIVLVVLLRVWIIRPEALLVAYGLIAAGLAVALQDIFKNFARGVTLFLTGVFNVGDRIEVGGTHGDVVDIGLFYTRVMEIRGWVRGDQATGRVVTVPNGEVLMKQVWNYTKDHPYLWDEIYIPLTYESDIKLATEICTRIAYEATEQEITAAEQNMRDLRETFYLTSRATTPAVYVEFTDNWVGMTLRYVVSTYERRQKNSGISQRILEAFAKEPSIEISSETVTVSSREKK